MNLNRSIRRKSVRGREEKEFAVTLRRQDDPSERFDLIRDFNRFIPPIAIKSQHCNNTIDFSLNGYVAWSMERIDWRWESQIGTVRKGLP